MRLSPAPVRSRTRGARTGTGPRPVMIARSGRWPWRTSRWRPSSVRLSAWPLRKAATSASTACANRARAPSRRTSVSGSENSAGWISLTTLSWVMAYHSFGGEVEARTPPRYAASTPHAVTNFRAYLTLTHAHASPLSPLIRQITSKRSNMLGAHATCVDAPLGARRIVRLGAARRRVLTCVRPLMRRVPCRGPGWESADRVQIKAAYSRYGVAHWFSRPRLSTVAPYPSSDLPPPRQPRGRADG